MGKRLIAMFLILLLIPLLLMGCEVLLDENGEDVVIITPEGELDAEELPPTGPTETPVEVEATPTEAEATPTEVEATPTEVEATPTEVEATPTEAEATPAETPEATPAPDEEVDEQELINLGETVYMDNCAVCHGENGEGVPDTYPALADNPEVTAEDPQPAIVQVVHGGGGMPAFGDQLSDQEIAAVVSYIRNAFGNDASIVTEEEVAEAREQPSP